MNGMNGTAAAASSSSSASSFPPQFLFHPIIFPHLMPNGANHPSQQQQLLDSHQQQQQHLNLLLSSTGCSPNPAAGMALFFQQNLASGSLGSSTIGSSPSTPLLPPQTVATAPLQQQRLLPQLLALQQQQQHQLRLAAAMMVTRDQQHGRHNINVVIQESGPKSRNYCTYFRVAIFCLKCGKLKKKLLEILAIEIF
jgi:hypothetical protein